jgi:3-methyl-2-oxobutanoate hydroxymethyltransferase
MKQEERKIVMLTAFDAPLTRLMDEAGADILLVGDSLGTVFQGHPTTLPVTMEQMLYHTSIVSRCSSRALVVADMPFLSFQLSAEDALKNAGRFLKESGAQAVKLEGGREMAKTIRRMTEAGIPVMGHIGYKPQSIHRYGKNVVQGKQSEAVQQLKEDLAAVQDAGAFSVVLEAVHWKAALELTEQAGVPTIGIGAGPHCDGQVLVTADMLGLFGDFQPKFVKRYAELGQQARKAFEDYAEDVRSGNFPDIEHSYGKPADDD